MTINLGVTIAWESVKCFSGNGTLHRITIPKHKGRTGTNEQHKANILGTDFAANITPTNYTGDLSKITYATIHGPFLQTKLSCKLRLKTMQLLFIASNCIWSILT